MLTRIDFSRNNLLGDIPTTIQGLKSLQFLSLGHNRLQGSITNSIGDLTSSKSLDLSNNNFSGAILVLLEKLLDIKDINLSFNTLEGDIPKEGPFTNFLAESLREMNYCMAHPISKFHHPELESTTHQGKMILS